MDEPTGRVCSVCFRPLAEDDETVDLASEPYDCGLGEAHLDCADMAHAKEAARG